MTGLLGGVATATLTHRVVSNSIGAVHQANVSEMGIGAGIRVVPFKIVAVPHYLEKLPFAF
jgi:hypothetical protein